MRKGAAGSSSMVKASRITPGIASGATLPQLSAPALPYEHPSPGSSLSTSVTLAPRRLSCHAAQTPTIPAPTTTTASLELPLMRIGVHYGGGRCHAAEAMVRRPVIALVAGPLWAAMIGQQ